LKYFHRLSQTTQKITLEQDLALINSINPDEENQDQVNKESSNEEVILLELRVNDYGDQLNCNRSSSQIKAIWQKITCKFNLRFQLDWEPSMLQSKYCRLKKSYSDCFEDLQRTGNAGVQK
jgi:hypothetical protein